MYRFMLGDENNLKRFITCIYSPLTHQFDIWFAPLSVAGLSKTRTFV